VISLNDDSIINELNFCYAAQQSNTDVFKDNTILIRGANSLAVNKLLSKMHFFDEEKEWLKPPAASLKLSYIYGVQTADRRHTVMYVHFFGSIQPNRQEKK